MAYQEFYKQLPNQYPIDFTGLRQGFTAMMQAVGNLYAQKQARRKAANQYENTVEYGENENDNRIIEQQSRALVMSAKQDIMKYGDLSPNTLAYQTQLEREAADRKVQYKLIKDAASYIDTETDPYYDKGMAHQDLKTAVEGEDGERNFLNRRPYIDSTLQRINKGTDYFLIDKFTQDYTKDLIRNERSKGVTTEGTTGESSYDNVVKSPFLDPNTGEFKITDKDIQRYIGAHKNVEPKLNELVDKDLMSDVQKIKQLKKSNDKRVDWVTSGMSDREVLLHVIQNPEDNPFSETKNGVPKSYNELKFEKAKDILEKNVEAQQIVSSEFKPLNRKTNAANGNIYNPKIVSDVTTFPTGDGSTSPGAILRTDEGKSIPIPINGFKDFHVTGHQSVVKSADGTKSMPIPGKNVDDQIKYIHNMSDEQVRKFSPQMDVAVRGFTLDKGQQLEEIDKFENKLYGDLSNAVNDGDQKQQALIQNKINKIRDYRVGISSNSSDLTKLKDLAAQAGFNANINDNQFLDTDEAFSVIKSITSDKGKGGLDLRNPQHWTPDERKLKQAWDSRFAELEGKVKKNYVTSPVKEVKKSPKETSAESKVQPKASLLNKGEIMIISPEGKKYAIPAEDRDEAVKQGYKVIE